MVASIVITVEISIRSDEKALRSPSRSARHTASWVSFSVDLKPCSAVARLVARFESRRETTVGFFSSSALTLGAAAGLVAKSASSSALSSLT